MTDGGFLPILCKGCYDFLSTKGEDDVNLRFVLLCFQVVSRLNISLKKSEMMQIVDKRDEENLIGVFGMQNC